jgi:NADPH-dependent 2,4-dienoyl-CoA reductase/sulfur reductase-like enzyme/rhodanese-related sulfurtransferase
MGGSVVEEGIKIIIIGAVAAGTSAAAKIRRKSESAEIVIYEKDSYISYGTCGLPYFVSEKIKDIDNLIIYTPEHFEKRFNLKIKTLHEVTGINPVKKQILVKNLTTAEYFNDYFDRLIIATGSIPIKLKFDDDIKNSENIFGLKTIDDAVRLKKYMDKIDRKSNSKKKVVIIGGGFIGLELLEAFLDREYKVSIVEKTLQILPMFDKEIIDYLESYLKEKGVNIYRGDEVVDLVRDKSGRIISVKTLNNETLKADILFLGIGTVPNIKLARDFGIKIGKSGSIAVDEFMRTNFKYIYAAGDCCECNNLLTGISRSYNLANIAGRQGRVAGSNAVGGRDKFSGSVANSIIKVLDLAMAKIGLSFKEAVELGINADFIELHNQSHAGYYPGADMIHMIIIFNKKTGKILGFQAIGRSGVDKRVDVVSTAMTGNLRIWKLADLDLGYHPAYGSARDPINMLGLIAGNLKKGEIGFLSVDRLKEKIRKVENITILDVRTKREYDEGHINGAVLIPIDNLRKNIDKLDRRSQIIIYCRTGYRAYQGFRILKNLGFKNVKVLNGSYLSWIRKI